MMSLKEASLLLHPDLSCKIYYTKNSMFLTVQNFLASIKKHDLAVTIGHCAFCHAVCLYGPYSS
jgi:hypothetical protein